MASVVLNEVGKAFGPKGHTTFVLNKVTVTFPSQGLVVIQGSSGSGKSTLLNLLSGMDTPTSGTIVFAGQTLTSLSAGDLCRLRRHAMGRVFQHYELFDELDVLTNAVLPLLIQGEPLGVAQKRGEELLEQYGLLEQEHKKARYLSGGEKQRVALIRGIIHRPQVLLADEPTGALDRKNAQHVVDLLRDFSKQALVIVVTHDVKLFMGPETLFATMKDGQCIPQWEHPTEEAEANPKERFKKKTAPHWPRLFAQKNFMARKKINALGIVASGIAWASCLLTLGFSLGSKASILRASERYFDLQTATLSKVTRTPVEDNPLTLIQSQRPSLSEMAHFSTRFETLRFDVDLSPLFMSSLKADFQNREVLGFSFCPVRDFTFSEAQKALLSEGTLPSRDNFTDLIINREMEELLTKGSEKPDLVGKRVTLAFEKTMEFPHPTQSNQTVRETFSFSQEFFIAAVVEETTFLNEPRAYYSHRSAKAFLGQNLLTAMGALLGRPLSWLECLQTASSNAPLSAYRYLVFIQNEEALLRLYDFSVQTQSGNATYEVTSNAFTNRRAFSSIAEILQIALLFFVAIAVLGSFFILGISGYSSFISHLKESAILSSLGATHGEIRMIFLSESLWVGAFAAALGIMLSLPFQAVINQMVSTNLGIEYPVNIPFSSFLGFRFLLVFLLFALSMGWSFLATWIPISFFKKGQLVTFLRDE